MMMLLLLSLVRFWCFVIFRDCYLILPVASQDESRRLKLTEIRYDNKLTSW